MCFGSRLIGCRVDSSERSFGRTLFSSEFLTAAICGHNYKPSVMTVPRARTVDFAAPLQPLRRHAYYSYPFPVSSLATWPQMTRTRCHQCVYPIAFPITGGVESSNEDRPGWPLLSL